MPEPGVGIEIENRSIYLINNSEAAKNVPAEEGGKIKGKQLLIPDVSRSGEFISWWSPTAELAGGAESGVQRLTPEFIVHGPDVMQRPGTGQGVKLDDANAGVLARIGKDIQDFLMSWTASSSKSLRIKGYESAGTWEANNVTNMEFKYWGLQVTAPVPLSSLYQILPMLTEGELLKITSPLIFRAERLVKVQQQDLPADIALHQALPQGLALDALLGFLSLVTTYLKGAKTDTSGQGLKHVVSIMPRTDFTTMWKMCHGSIDTNSISRLAEHLCGKFEISLEQTNFKWKDKMEVHELSANQWLEELPTKDLIAEWDKMYRHGQIGGLGALTEHVIGHSEIAAPVFEFRDLGSVLTTGIEAKLRELEENIRQLHQAAVVT